MASNYSEVHVEEGFNDADDQAESKADDQADAVEQGTTGIAMNPLQPGTGEEKRELPTNFKPMRMASGHVPGTNFKPKRSRREAAKDWMDVLAENPK